MGIEKCMVVNLKGFNRCCGISKNSIYSSDKIADIAKSLVVVDMKTKEYSIVKVRNDVDIETCLSNMIYVNELNELNSYKVSRY